MAGVRGSIRQMTSLLLSSSFQTDWFKVPFLGELETIIKLGIKPWFGDVGWSTCDSILGLLSLL